MTQRIAVRSLRPAEAQKHSINTHAPAHPAAEAISDKGRPRRRSVKNRKSFDCFKSAVRHPIQRRRRADPEIVSPRRFLGYLLSEQKVTYEKSLREILRLFRAAQFAAASPRRTATRRWLVHVLRRRRTASRGPKTEKTPKNVHFLLDVAIICTTFGPSDPSKKT